MVTVLFIIVVILALIHIAAMSITDDKRVRNSLNKKELYNMSVVKDIVSAVIILILLLLPFVMGWFYGVNVI